MWSVQEAKAKLSEVLRLAREGHPQVIGTKDPCVVVSARDFVPKQPEVHLGRWLVENAPRGADIELPSRHDSTREIPFADEDDDPR